MSRAGSTELDRLCPPEAHSKPPWPSLLNRHRVLGKQSGGGTPRAVHRRVGVSLSPAAHTVWISWPTKHFAYKKALEPAITPHGRVFPQAFRKTS